MPAFRQYRDFLLNPDLYLSEITRTDGPLFLIKNDGDAVVIMNAETFYALMADKSLFAEKGGFHTVADNPTTNSLSKVGIGIVRGYQDYRAGRVIDADLASEHLAAPMEEVEGRYEMQTVTVTETKTKTETEMDRYLRKRLNQIANELGRR